LIDLIGWAAEGGQNNQDNLNERGRIFCVHQIAKDGKMGLY